MHNEQFRTQPSEFVLKQTKRPAPPRLRLPLALKNLLRQRRRTGLALSAIVFGVIAVLLTGGFIEWIFWAMRESTIRSQLGHVQVVRPGFYERAGADPFSYLLPEESSEMRAIEIAQHVELVAPRLNFSGLISHGDTTVSFVGQGVDPKKEEKLSEYLRIRKGRGLSSARPEGIVLGAGLANNVGVEPGDSVVLLARTASGGINAVEARIMGLFTTSRKAFDDAALRVPITMARTLLRVSGAHTWVLLLDESRYTDRVLEHLESRFPQDVSQMEFAPWYVLADFYNKTVTLFSRQLSVVELIIALIIVLSISNVLIMSVLDRTGEIGTLMALGLRRRRILGLFLTEGVWLGFVGGIAGCGAGFLLAQAINIVGIPMPPPPGMDVGFTAEILVKWPLVINALALALVTTLVASFYPAWKASRFVIVDALRRNK